MAGLEEAHETEKSEQGSLWLEVEQLQAQLLCIRENNSLRDLELLQASIDHESER